MEEAQEAQETEDVAPPARSPLESENGGRGLSEEQNVQVSSELNTEQQSGAGASFHMTPFMLKHVQNYMLQNKEMMNVASLAGDVRQSVGNVGPGKAGKESAGDPFASSME